MRVAVLQVGGAEAVAAAILLDLPEEHLRLTLPGQLREFIDGGDEQGGQKAIDLFVDDEDGETLSIRLLFAEGALAVGIAAIDERAPSAAPVGLDFDVFAALDGGAAPGTVGELARTAAAAEEAATHSVFLLVRLRAVIGGVWSGALTDPQAEAEGGRTPCGAVRAPEHLAGADERRGALELLQGEQAQGVAHNHGHPVQARAARDRALQAANGEGVGGEAKIRLGLAAASGKPEQVGEGVGVGAALGMVQVRQRRQVEQDEGQLEGTPAAVVGLVEDIQRHFRVVFAPLLGVDGVQALLPHGAVHEGEGALCVGATREHVDATAYAFQRAAAVGERLVRDIAVLREIG